MMIRNKDIADDYLFSTTVAGILGPLDASDAAPCETDGYCPFRKQRLHFDSEEDMCAEMCGMLKEDDYE